MRTLKKAALDKDGDEPVERQGIQVIARAAAILRVLQDSKGSLTLGEIAKRVTLPRSTVQRIVDALDRERLVIAATAISGVRLGPALVELAARSFPIAQIARSTLEAIAKDTGESVDLSVADQRSMLFVDQIAGTHRLAAVSAVGVSFPLHASANGKAVLAALPDDELERVRRHLKLTPFTENTLTSWDKLETALVQIRTTGLAYDREEHTLGICAIGKAFRAPSGDLCAISIPVPTQRFRAMEEAYAEKLDSHCRALQKKLGSY